jgi:ribosomal protein S18 acetylase RimI-like enzyme
MRVRLETLHRAALAATRGAPAVIWFAGAVLEQAAGLSSSALDAIAELERRVVEADGGRLKLEWGMLRRRAGDRIEDLLWWEGNRLLGFLGFYSFGSSLELAGMVAPDARRRGIGTALLDAAAPHYRERELSEALLIVPRPSVAGKRLALRRGAVLDHSEHALALAGDPAGGPSEPALSLRPATAADLQFLTHLLEDAFGEPPPDGFLARLDLPQERTLIVEVEGAGVGTLRVTRDGDDAAIYGFAVDPRRQGRGIGRSALRLACEQLRRGGARRIRLEVAVENDRALGLYTSLGFTAVTTEDYFALPLG